MHRPLLVLSDVHLSRIYGDRAACDLAQLLALYPDCEVMLAGDIFDLTLDPAELPGEASMSAALTPHPRLVAALARHVRGGGSISLVPGNHDAVLADPSVLVGLRRELGAPNDDCVAVYPWFARRGDIHIEHGHLYDPDCAPNHPLADPNPHHEGLGNALTRRFVAPNEAYVYSHKNQVTMTSGISSAFAKWGPRAPVVIARYFYTAFCLTAEAGLKKPVVERDKEQGQSRLGPYAASQALVEDALVQLLRTVPVPTHHSARDVFFRLYFDRVYAACSLALGTSMLFTAGLGAALGVMPLVTAAGTLTKSGALLGALGAGYLGLNVAKRRNRYGDAVIGQLDQAAADIIQATDARLVVLGHSHVEVDRPGYVNLGSFGFGRQGRPYLLIDRDGHHEKRLFSPGA